MENNISFRTQKVIDGVIKSAEAMEVTLGAAGANAILDDDGYEGFIITNDGYSILEKLSFDDPWEDLGRKILTDAVSRANKQSGDGSTTTAVLTKSILVEGLKTGGYPMEIKRGLDELLPTIEKYIDDNKKEITPDTVSQVAAISAESPEIGKLIEEVYKAVGKDGVIHLDNSNSFETYLEVKDGISFDVGSLSPWLYNKVNFSELINPYVLVTNNKISSLADVAGIYDKINAKDQRELLVFCDEITPQALFALVQKHTKGLIKTMVVCAPTIWKQYVLQDVAKATGATFISTESGIGLKDIQLEHLGTCDEIIVNETETKFLGTKDVSEYIETLKSKGDNDSLRRIAWLATKSVVVRLGANSATELKYKHDKVEDAIHAAKLALDDGVVTGGGVCLMEIARKLQTIIPLEIGINGEEKKSSIPICAYEILSKSLKSPFKQNAENAGVSVDHILQGDDEFLLDSPFKDNINSILLPKDNGLNTNTKQIVNMWEAGIVDPAKVLKNCIRNAISVAGTALTIKVAVKKNRTEEEIAMNFIKKQQQRF